MAGKTGMLVGLMKDEYVHLPLKMVTSGTKVDTGGNVWMRSLKDRAAPINEKCLNGSRIRGNFFAYPFDFC